MGKPQINAWSGWCWKIPPQRCPATRTQTMHGGSSLSRLNSPPPLASPLASPLQDGTASSRSGSERPRSQLDEPRTVASKEVRVLGESPAASSVGRLTETQRLSDAAFRCRIVCNAQVLKNRRFSKILNPSSRRIWCLNLGFETPNSNTR